MHISRRLNIQLTQTRQRNVGNSNIGTQACSHSCSSLTNDTTAQYQYLCRTDTRHTAYQFTLTALSFLQIVSTVQSSHTSCHLTHRLQQRQRAVRQLYSFVCQTDSTALQHSLRQFLLAGEVEIRKQQLAFANKSILLLNRFLHLYYHVTLTIDIFYCRQNTSTSLHILVVGESTPLACCMLHAHFVTTTGQFCYSRRCHTNAVLIVLNLFRNSYFHKIVCV